MARRGRKKKVKLQVKQDTLKSAVSVAMLIAAGLILISFFAPDYSINSKIQKIVRGLFGFPSILLPLILIISGLLYTQAVKWKYIELRILFGLSALMLSLSAFFSLINLDGGKFGDLVFENMKAAISSVGAFVVLFSLLVISVIFIMDISFKEFAQLIGDFLTGMKGKLPAKGSKDVEEDEIKITSGVGVLSESTGMEKDKKEIQEEIELPEPSFEIIPSLSEPKQEVKQEVVRTGSGSAMHPGLPYSDKVWEVPPLDLLSDPSTTPVDRGDVKKRAEIIVDTLRSFGIESTVKHISYGPTVTQYALEAASGVRISRVSSLHHDLALALASPTGSVRIEAPIPGKSLIGIEVPNNTRVPVFFKDVFLSDTMKGTKSKRAIVLGKDVSGQALVYDIAKMPHLLVAGATGSGKSVFLHSIIFSLLFRCSPQECKFIFIDPKRVELDGYDGIPHLMAPVIKDIDRAAAVFRWAVEEMERRYKLLEQAKVRNINDYNEKSGFQAMSFLVIIADELAEIMVADPAAVEKSIIRISQLARAVGIHLILTTQRPDTNVLTGLIKANIPCRVSFNVVSQIDSRVIIDQPGAEKLLGQGDMLFVPPDASKPIRIQGAWVSDKEISGVVNYLKSTGMQPEFSEDIFELPKVGKSISAGGEEKDDLFDDAVEVVVSTGKGSASLLQRRLSIGYARAARILDELEAEGIVGPAQGSKPRDVLIKAVPGGESDNLVLPNEKMQLEAETLI